MSDPIPSNVFSGEYLRVIPAEGFPDHDDVLLPKELVLRAVRQNRIAEKVRQVLRESPYVFYKAALFELIVDEVARSVCCAAATALEGAAGGNPWFRVRLPRKEFAEINEKMGRPPTEPKEPATTYWQGEQP